MLYVTKYQSTYFEDDRTQSKGTVAFFASISAKGAVYFGDFFENVTFLILYVSKSIFMFMLYNLLDCCK